MIKRRHSLGALFGRHAVDDAHSRHATEAPNRRPWTREERTLLRAGDTVFRHGPAGSSDTGVAAVLASAPPDILWKHILAFDQYVDFLPYITASRSVTLAKGNACDVYDADFQITTKGVVSSYQVRHWHYANKSWLPFRMVSNESGGAVRGGEGGWQVTRWDEDPQKSLLCYEVRLRTSRLVPSFMKRLAANRGLPTAATLIARRAEESTSSG